MSHIRTAPHVGRGRFDALPQLHVTNGDLGDYESRHEYDEHAHQVYERQDDENLPRHGHDRLWSSSTTADYSQVSTSYKPDMIISYNEVAPGVPPAMDRELPNYKPSALRWPFLLTLLTVILALVGLIAWALHVLPVLDNKLDVFNDDLHARGIVAHAPIHLAGRAETPIATSIATSTPSESAYQPTISATLVQGDFGHVSEHTVSKEAGPSTTPPPTTTKAGPHSTSSIEPAYSKEETDFGNIGAPVTISESIPTPTIFPSVAETDYGDVGSKTISEGILASNDGDAGPITVSETVPQTPTFVTPHVTTITNSEGVTTTSTSIPEPVSTAQTTTLTDSEGRPTATQETSVLVTPSITVQMDSSGVPTATATLYPVIPPPSKGSNNNSNSNVVVKTYSISYGQYFIGMFLPTLLAIALAIPIRILDVNAKILQPWHELTHARGAPGRASLCKDTSGWPSVTASVRSLAGGQALVFLTTLLVVASALLIPLAAEAVAFDLRGVGCAVGSGSARNCAYVLSVFGQAADATLACLALMGAAVFLVLVVLVRWRSGVGTNPWSVCGTASLALNADVRRLFTSLPAGVDMGKMPASLLQSVLADHWFKLGYFYGPNGTVEYGIMLDDSRGADYVPDHLGDDVKEPQDHHAAPTKASHHLPFLMLGYAGRLVFLFVLCGLLALVLYYNNTGGDTPFENFMDSESFGVRFLFTGVGVIISFFWASFFSGKLHSSPCLGRYSPFPSPATNSLQRHRNN